MSVLHSRINNADDSGKLYLVDIVGFCVAGAIMIGLAIWAFTKLARRRATGEMKSRSGMTLSVQGIVKESITMRSEKALPK